MKTYDVIVAGLGAMGSAALYQLAKGGVRALGIDRFDPPHELGSTHGETRITRSSVGEGEEYVPLVLRSNDIWAELSESTGRELLKRTGGLIFSSGGEGSVLHGKDILGETIRIAQKFGIRHDVLDLDDLERRFPDMRFGPDARGYFEYGSGYLRPELCVEANIRQAIGLGAGVRTDETVLAIDQTAGIGTVIVETDKETYECGRLILSVGPWIKKLLSAEKELGTFRIFRQTMYWFETEADYSDAHFPVYIKAGSDEHSSFYGFPSVDGSRSVKIGLEQFADETDPDSVDREVSADDVNKAYKLVSQNFRIRQNGSRSKTCLYTVTDDFGFVIDFLPGNENVLVVSPCSGHGFKHSAGVGLLAKQMVTGVSAFTDVAPFSFKRS
jgi:sarcosine oxidase